MATATDNRADLVAALQEKRAAIKRIRDSDTAIVIEGKNVTADAEAVKDLRTAVKEAEELKGLIESLDAADRIDTWADAPAGGSVAGKDAAAGRADVLALKSIGELFTESKEFREYMEAGKPQGGSSAYNLKARNIGRLGYQISELKDIYTAAGGTFTAPAWGTRQNDGLIIPAYRTQRVRDLFPVATTTANLIEYVRRTGYVNNARTIAERTAADGGVATGGPTDVFGLKPPSNLTFTSETAPIRVIAHTLDVSKTILDDEPRLQDTLNGEMLYGLRLTEDAEILFGDGSGTHLTGIMNTPGIQAYSQSSGPGTDYKSDAVRRAMTLIMLAYYESTGVVLHPFDWEDMELEKDNQNRYVLVTNVAVGAETRIWRNPVVATPAMTHGEFLVGAFGLGAKLYDREAANIAISTETRDLFDRNAIAIRAEERVGLEVGRPEAFVAGTFS